MIISQSPKCQQRPGPPGPYPVQSPPLDPTEKIAGTSATKDSTKKGKL